jgi:hypothetical protein
LDTEIQFLHKLSGPISTVQLLSQVLRWGHEGCVPEQEKLPEIAIELERCAEKILAFVNARKIELEHCHPGTSAEPLRTSSKQLLENRNESQGE